MYRECVRPGPSTLSATVTDDDSDSSVTRSPVKTHCTVTGTYLRLVPGSEPHWWLLGRLQLTSDQWRCIHLQGAATVVTISIKVTSVYGRCVPCAHVGTGCRSPVCPCHEERHTWGPQGMSVVACFYSLDCDTVSSGFLRFCLWCWRGEGCVWVCVAGTQTQGLVHYTTI